MLTLPDYDFLKFEKRKWIKCALFHYDEDLVPFRIIVTASMLSATHII